MKKIGIPFIIAAPSGAGKTTLIKSLCESMENVAVSVSHTTRPRRPEEKEGVNYHFVSKETFEKLITYDTFLEYANVFGHYYGTSALWVDEKLQSGINVLLDIDWQGARQLKQKLPQCISIFILPPTLEVLRQRLTTRAQDNPQVIEKRMSQAKDELSHYHEFDYLVVNEEFNKALTDCQAIIYSQHLARAHHQVELKELLANLLA